MATFRATFVCYHMADAMHKRGHIFGRAQCPMSIHTDLCPRVKAFDGKCPVCADGVSNISPINPITTKTKQQLFVCSTKKHYFATDCGKPKCLMARGGVLQQLYKIAAGQANCGAGSKRKSTGEKRGAVPAFFKPQCLTCNCEKPQAYCLRCSLFHPYGTLNTELCVEAFATAATADSVACVVI